jgi:hypothetical protein
MAALAVPFIMSTRLIMASVAVVLADLVVVVHRQTDTRRALLVVAAYWLAAKEIPVLVRVTLYKAVLAAALAVLETAQLRVQERLTQSADHP